MKAKNGWVPLSVKKLDKTTNVWVPVSVGELLDKISILEIKVNKISDADRKKCVVAELASLRYICKCHGLLDLKAIAELKKVNAKLWSAEDAVRNMEKNKSFGRVFVFAARQIYLNNDLRFKIKDRINRKYKSDVREQKSYGGGT
jgi:hypothetical protein